MYLLDGYSRLKVDIHPSQPSMTGDFKRAADYIDYKMIPPFLLQKQSLDIYSTSDEVEDYFRGTLVKFTLQTLKPIALTYLSLSNKNILIAIYLNVNSLKLKCCIIDFSILTTLISIPYVNKSGVISPTASLQQSVDTATTAVQPHSIPNTSIFDKVLSKRKQLVLLQQPQQNLFMMAPVQPKTTALSSQILTTNEQISQAVSKLVLSGLRLRGLSGFMNSSSQSSNEKLAVREIYQMTLQCAMFALRKFNYGFNKQLQTHQVNPAPVRLNDIQDIVENLLLVFIDMDDSRSTT